MIKYKLQKIKICCISHLNEAKLAIEYGASAIGLVGSMPSGPGIIPDQIIKKIAAHIPRNIDSFLLTSETNSKAIIEHHRRTQTSTIQLVDEQTLEVYNELRKALPRIKLVQVIHVLDGESIDQANNIQPFVDAILLDSGNPKLKTKILGGTGQVHNWEISRAIREKVTVPTYLAGGLRAENVAKAIDQVKPFGIDLCSGVRTNDHLDEQKLKAFFAAAKINYST